MTKEQRAKLHVLKREISAPKHALIEMLRQVEELSPRQAEQLSRIIARLEDWQNK